MIDKFEILQIANSVGLQNSTIEKDYVLGWILMAIQKNAKTSNSWIFKGGTCLKKCFFDEYRFSEDLEFTLTNPAQMDESILKTILKELAEWENMLSLQLPKLKPFETFWNQLHHIFNWFYEDYPHS